MNSLENSDQSATSDLDAIEAKLAPAVELGDSVRDTLSNFEGIVTGVAAYLHLPDQVLVSSRGLGHDGKTVTEWFPLTQIEFVSREG